MNKLNKSIDLSKIYDNKIVQIIFSILFSLSTACITAILITGEWSNTVLDIVLPTLSFLIMLFISIKFSLLKNIFSKISKATLIVSIILGIYAVYLTYLNMPEYSTTFAHLIFVILAIPATIIILYWFYTKFWYYFKSFIKSLDKMERNFLIVSISIFSIAIIVIYNMTTLFTDAYIPEPYRHYNLLSSAKNEETIERGQKFVERSYHRNVLSKVYTTDTQIILYENIYTDINGCENDIRQPFFAIFSLPFTILPKMISDFSFDEIYPFLLAIAQTVLAFITIILLQRLMKLKGWTRLLFMLFLTLTFPTLLFVINMEQYVISVFYLIAFIYMSFKGKEHKDIAYIAATGTMITSGLFFPLLLEKKNWKENLKNILYTFLKAMAILIISARILLISPVKIEKQYENISRFFQEDTTFGERMNMYTNFALNTLIAPQNDVTEDIFLSQSLISGEYKYVLHAFAPQLVQTNNKVISIGGIIILLLVLLGFILNRKDKFSRICILWILFSFILMSILKYGASENGFILYTYYFGWAFVCLLFKFFESVLKKWPKIKNTIYSLVIATMCIINFYGIYQIIEFGMQYYK